MCHGLSGTVRKCPVIRRSGFKGRMGQRTRSEFERADRVTLEQLTREIWPRLVTEVTMCPRSSLHRVQNLSIRSPTVNTGFSIEFSLSRSFVPLQVYR